MGGSHLRLSQAGAAASLLCLSLQNPGASVSLYARCMGSRGPVVIGTDPLPVVLEPGAGAEAGMEQRERLWEDSLAQWVSTS